MKAVYLIVSRWEHTTPNYITLARLALCILGLDILYSVSPWLMALCCVLGMACDALDGWWARTFHCASFSGKLLDPLVDKVIAWNAAVVIAAWAAGHHAPGSSLVLYACLPPMALIGVYDYMTMTLRGSDEKMSTNAVARQKQAMLFISLQLLLFAICFADASVRWPERSSLFAVQVLLEITGTALMWVSLRLTALSAKIYLRQTKDPAALRWSRVLWVRAILSTIA